MGRESIFYWYPNVPLPQQVTVQLDQDEEIQRLAHFIMDEIPGEPSRSEGVVDTAIRLLREATVRH